MTETKLNKKEIFGAYEFIPVDSVDSSKEQKIDNGDTPSIKELRKDYEARKEEEIINDLEVKPIL